MIKDENGEEVRVVFAHSSPKSTGLYTKAKAAKTFMRYLHTMRNDTELGLEPEGLRHLIGPWPELWELVDNARDLRIFIDVCENQNEVEKAKRKLFLI